MDRSLSSESTITTTITSTASIEEESKFLTRTQHLRHTRLALAILTFLTSIPTIACEAVALHHYRQTSPYARVWLNLWPLNLDLRPTIALLACGCVIAFQNLLYIVTAVVPSPRPHIRLLNLLAAATALSGFIAALVGLVFVIYQPGAKHPSGFSEMETLHSWTCKWGVVRDDYTSSGDGTVSASASYNATGGDVTVPVHFKRDCEVTRAGFALLCVLLGLEVVMGGVVAVGVWVKRKVGGVRGGSLEDIGRGGEMMKGESKVSVGGVEKYPGT
ncbi:hypothetical protein CBS63078_4724 [Aspergillus niger]|uniref:Uncharacterized protein n=4 Tax=Aspergillus niger TaxID=5061 RepID=A2QA91_ASPNC|nr:hypothetical protein An01g10620 [Aspergillus niger]XP_025450139.1 uncharacterized protein BO96DRAFT_167966 [Aspergillus niger CBS 101883]KAI2821927.1 hypothetical protein CBS115989_2527 [Aspergillus niger]KAI2832398.1 hypothetical protein CBS133816_1485 [Aspergillus niger]KAI2845238.1 hypothetical protein CBS11350_4257 [Aspergillus niger]KAI2853043.1 hypothetical protein CBS11232_5572 [Aspergillus niger]KAI2863757.1 hypothetical protein CBS12448_3518 [Aspergillus niger]|eukprot:XP_001389480.1 hypothetical protein ANI_1_2992014 [Aspergillus niger CBS 513.88]